MSLQRHIYLILFYVILSKCLCITTRDYFANADPPYHGFLSIAPATLLDSMAIFYNSFPMAATCIAPFNPTLALLSYQGVIRHSTLKNTTHLRHCVFMSPSPKVQGAMGRGKMTKQCSLMPNSPCEGGLLSLPTFKLEQLLGDTRSL